MCVDDYQYRHPSAYRQKICRRFIFRDQDSSQRVFLVNISQFERFGQLRISQILLHLQKKGLNVKDFKFNIPKLEITIEAGDQCLIPFNVLTEKQVLFNMEKIHENQDDYNNEQNCDMLFNHDVLEDDKYYCLSCKDLEIQIVDKQPQEQHKNILKTQSKQDANKEIGSRANTKRLKQLESTIYQSLSKNKLWRKLYEVGNFSLKNAAQVVGLSKKTLDDHFLVLRIGEELGYNFEENMQKKIGHLRSYIRDQPIKVKGRLKKTLKCFYLVPDPDINQYLCKNQWSKVSQMEQIEEQSIKTKNVSDLMQQQQLGSSIL